MLETKNTIDLQSTNIFRRSWSRVRVAVLPLPLSSYLSEVDSQMRIATPLILAALVNMGMAITDVIMMGWLGPVALAAGAVASDMYSLVFYLCAGVVAAVSAIVSHARGARQHRLIRRATQQGFWAVILLSPPAALIVWQAPKLLILVGVPATIIETAADYAAMMALTLLPMLGVAVWRQFLAAFADTRAVFRITLITLGLNALGNYVFMFGKLGFPSLGLAGAGLSSALCAAFMFAALTMYVVRHQTLAKYRLLVGILRPDWSRLAELFRLGLPIGVSNLGEMGVYLLSTAVVGIFGVEALAAHAVALRMAGVLYAFPLGLSQAATVRVGLATGAGNVSARNLAARTALGIAFLAGTLVLLSVGFARHDIAAVFVNVNSSAASIASYAALLLLVLAIMQIFEYVGTVAGGALRGIKDTQVPMLMSVTAYWGVAMTIGLGLGFGLNQEALGIWAGLAGGAVTFCFLLLARMHYHGRYTRRIVETAA